MRAEATIAQPRIDAVDDPFDPSSLPSIETITGNTDIRGFLQSRVPAELTRAALRQAWGERSGHPRLHRHRREPVGFQRPGLDTRFGLWWKATIWRLFGQALWPERQTRQHYLGNAGIRGAVVPAETCDEPVVPMTSRSKRLTVRRWRRRGCGSQQRSFRRRKCDG